MVGRNTQVTNLVCVSIAPINYSINVFIDLGGGIFVKNIIQ